MQNEVPLLSHLAYRCTADGHRGQMIHPQKTCMSDQDGTEQYEKGTGRSRAKVDRSCLLDQKLRLGSMRRDIYLRPGTIAESRS